MLAGLVSAVSGRGSAEATFGSFWNRNRVIDALNCSANVKSLIAYARLATHQQKQNTASDLLYSHHCLFTDDLLFLMTLNIGQAKRGAAIITSKWRYIIECLDIEPCVNHVLVVWTVCDASASVCQGCIIRDDHSAPVLPTGTNRLSLPLPDHPWSYWDILHQRLTAEPGLCRSSKLPLLHEVLSGQCCL